MKHTIGLALALVLCTTVSSAATEPPISTIPLGDQAIIELLDGYCLANEADFTKIDVLIQSEPKVVSLPKELLQATNPAATGTGKGWGIHRKGANYMIAYMDQGGCSISGEQADVDQLTRSLTATYRLVPIGTFDEGPQRQQWYRFTKDSIHASGVLQVTVGKFEQDGKKVWAINFVPDLLAQRIFSK